MKLKLIIILAALSFPLLTKAQEEIIGLHGNPVIEKHLQQRHALGFKTKSTAVINETGMQLPFFDDFTYDGPYPDSTLWEDNDAFVNTAFQKNPANRGVATLDALDANGHLHAGASQYPFIADYLTSQKIRTDSIINSQEQRKLTVNDSLFLSFFYQPQGLGNAPDKRDSLVLEFFVDYGSIDTRVDSAYVQADTLWINPEDHSEGYTSIIEAYWDYDTITIVEPDVWERVWSAPGMSLDSFYAANGCWMDHVMVFISDTVRFFRPDFRFRFKNYASLASGILPSWQSNMDQWNIDYVYLNYNRAMADTTYQDLSFVNPGYSFLRDYTAMPYKQYKADATSAMGRQFPRAYTNMDKVAQNATYSYRIYDSNGIMEGNDSDYYSIEWTNPIRPGLVVDSADIVVLFIPQAGKDSATYTITQKLIGDQVGTSRLSDSVTFVQKLTNFYAYDDGVPEAGYGLSVEESMLAVRFPLNVADTLRAIDIFFNSTPTRQDSSYIEYFDLMIWNDNHEEPGEVLYSAAVEFNGAESGKFIRFHLDTPIKVVSGFFAGIKQRSSDNINIGFDYSNNMRNRNMYRIYNDPWQASSYEGSIMIRPVLGNKIKEDDKTPAVSSVKRLEIYPNPVVRNNTVWIRKPDSFKEEHRISVDIYNAVTKQNVYSGAYTSSGITPQSVAPGVYVVRLTNQTTGETAISKLIITH